VRVIATAGHVDHGKSTLVTALTGMDTDRLAEEKARGLTIDLGFAWTTLAGPVGGDVELAIIDVPGHSRFVTNMIAGVGGVAGCLFVVSAVEGWMPQSEEHLRVLELAGLKGGVIALTRCAGVEDRRRKEVKAQLEQSVSGSFLEAAPLVETDAPHDLGMTELREALHALVVSQPPPIDGARPRLYADRSFTMKGYGTVVTGTLTGGSLAAGDTVTVLEPGRQPVAARVRALEALQRPRARVAPGERVACNLSGTGRARFARGTALFAPGTFKLTDRFDASFSALPGLRHAVTERGAFTAHVGSGDYAVRLSWLGGVHRVEPGGTAAVRVRLPVCLPLTLGDRFIVRESGRAETVGGGEVLDLAPVRPVSKARPSGRPEAIVAERGYLDAGELGRLSGARIRPNVGRFVASPEWLLARREVLTSRMASAGSAGIELSELDEIDRGILNLLESAVIRFGRARLVPPGGPAGGCTEADLAVDGWLAQLVSAPFEPPPPAAVPRGQLRELVQDGSVVESRGIHFARGAVDEGRRRMHALLQMSPGGVSLAEFRSALGTSRRFALALLEHFDATGVTRRRGDVRMAGPRLSAGGAGPGGEDGGAGGAGRAGEET
jgi:selenocysteine-specific elongation factor